jgi:hypothetical protein
LVKAVKARRGRARSVPLGHGGHGMVGHRMLFLGWSRHGGRGVVHHVVSRYVPARLGETVMVRLGPLSFGVSRYGGRGVMCYGFACFGSAWSRHGGQLTANKGEKIWLVFQRKNVKELLTNT